MARKQVATRLDEPEYDRLTDYADENGLSQSEAMRRVIGAGLDELEADTTPNTMNQAAAVPIGTAATAAGLVVAVNAVLPTVQSPVALGGLLLVGVAFIVYGISGGGV
jgi:hypothetical protein